MKTEQQGQQKSPRNFPRVPRIAFGLVPLTTPYQDSDPDLRVLNAVARGLLFENTRDASSALGLSKGEYNRTLKSLRNSGQIFLNPEGKYQLTFDTSNFPNISTRENRL